MTRLFDFDCYWFKGHEDEMLRGQFLLNEEGWFEGVAANIFHGKKIGESMIYGVCKENEGIEILRISSEEGVPAFSLSGVKTPEGFEGQSYMILPLCGEFVKMACTEFFVTIQDVEKIGQRDRDIMGEKQLLSTKVETLKTCEQYRALYRASVESMGCQAGVPKEDAGPRISLNNEPK